jgi:hypothetical protein
MPVERERVGAAQMLGDGYAELVHPCPERIAALADVKHNAH